MLRLFQVKPQEEFEWITATPTHLNSALSVALHSLLSIAPLDFPEGVDRYQSDASRSAVGSSVETGTQTMKDCEKVSNNNSQNKNRISCQFHQTLPNSGLIDLGRVKFCNHRRQDALNP